jgi:hypothetical protein
VLVNLMVNKSPTAKASWGMAEEWSNAERVPGAGELVKLGSETMRVYDVCQTSPYSVDLYLVPAYLSPS